MVKRLSLLFYLLLLFISCNAPDTETPSQSESNNGSTPAGRADGHAVVSETENPIGRVMLARLKKPFFGDLGEMRNRRMIRVLVANSKTNFFYDGATARGFEYELLREYEKFLNRSAKGELERVTLIFIPLPFNRLLTALADGQGDIAAAGLTITPERKKLAAFTYPYIPRVEEVLVTNRNIRNISTLDDLSGCKVYVREGSSYITHLHALNREFTRAGEPGVRIFKTTRDLTTEDILELVNAGIVDLTVADRHIAETWSGVLKDIAVREDIVIHTGDGIGWAVRKKNPELLTSLNRFIRKNRKGSLLGNILFKRYFQNEEWIKNPVSAEEQKKLDTLEALFRKYAEQYGFDWLKLAAQAYQESGLDQSRVSRAGAVGIMQILPRTASDPSVGIKNIHELENNIHAGTKYLHYLREKYFNNPEIDPADRMDFAWAAYNAGPGNIIRMRNLAEKRGLDPNRWFYNVEIVTAEVIGREPVRYVSNVNKYYTAYRLYFDMNRRREAESGGKGRKRPE